MLNTSKVKEKAVIDVDENLCKACHICIDVCPKKVLAPSPKLNFKGLHVPIPINIDACIKCKLCEYYCPDFAIAVK